MITEQKLTTAPLRSNGLLSFDVTWVKPHEVRRAIVHKTGLIIVETPANPTLKLVDVWPFVPNRKISLSW